MNKIPKKTKPRTLKRFIPVQPRSAKRARSRVVTSEHKRKDPKKSSKNYEKVMKILYKQDRALFTMTAPWQLVHACHGRQKKQLPKQHRGLRLTKLFDCRSRQPQEKIADRKEKNCCHQ